MTVAALPDKLSELITVALNDLRLVEQDDRYEVDMAAWHHRPNGEGSKCQVCLAGAVMAKSCMMPIDVAPGLIDNKFVALNSARQGYLHSALFNFGVPVPPNLENIYVPAYKDDPNGFFAAMEAIVTYLKEQGL